MLIEMDGMRLLTDPVLRRRVGHLWRHARPPLEGCWQQIDAVLISHVHADHLDMPSLRRLRRDTRLIVPSGLTGMLERRGFRRVEALERGRSTTVGPLEVRATPANHSGFMPPFGPTADSIGFAIYGSQRIYFAGDTDLFPEMEMARQELDIALLPVWGWGPRLGAGHMDPHRAARALELLRPRMAVPIHWGTFCPLGMGWLRPGFLSEPPHTFARHAADLAPEVQVHILAPGQSLPLEAHSGAATPPV
jgi:L-ascorbate metabolism protein UlaG (beta-lactamase superfamily)